MPKHGLSYSSCGRKFSFLLFFKFVLLFVFRVIYSRGDKLPERVDVELKSVIDKVEPTVIKNVGFDNSSYTLIATGE